MSDSPTTFYLLAMLQTQGYLAEVGAIGGDFYTAMPTRGNNRSSHSLRDNYGIKLIYARDVLLSSKNSLSTQINQIREPPQRTAPEIHTRLFVQVFL